jgi:hypothetical protein
MFYTFNQNNSGGVFDQDDNVTHFTVVEGDTVEEILQKADDIGIYFNGVDEGRDCDCCGDRWNPPWDEDDLTEGPDIYGNTPEEYLQEGNHWMLWMDPGKEIVIHYKDGTKKWY